MPKLSPLKVSYASISNHLAYYDQVPGGGLEKRKKNSYELFGEVSLSPLPRIEPTNLGKERGVSFSQSADNHATKRAFGNGSAKTIQQLKDSLRENFVKLYHLIEKLNSRMKDIGQKIDEKIGTERIIQSILKLFKEMQSQIGAMRKQQVEIKEMREMQKADLAKSNKTLKVEIDALGAEMEDIKSRLWRHDYAVSSKKDNIMAETENESAVWQDVFEENPYAEIGDSKNFERTGDGDDVTIYEEIDGLEVGEASSDRAEKEVRNVTSSPKEGTAGGAYEKPTSLGNVASAYSFENESDESSGYASSPLSKLENEPIYATLDKTRKDVSKLFPLEIPPPVPPKRY